VKRGQPVDLPLNQVFPCWAEGVRMMKVGGKAKLVCPSDIAYGDRGRPPVVPGGATLIFEVELLGTKEQPAQATPPAPPLPPAPKGKK
jgi:FKBP-type peptidyl-prolyl cis-trans isomerase FkpA